MIDLDEGFWQWFFIAILAVNTVIALTVSLRAGDNQRHIYELEGKIRLLIQLMYDTGKEVEDDDDDRTTL